MQYTVIRVLGAHPEVLCVGSVQCMNLYVHNYGQSWLSPIDSINAKYDWMFNGDIAKDKFKAELLIALKMSGVNTMSKQYLKPELVDICNQYNIPVKVTTNTINGSWCGSPRGYAKNSLQIILY